jgi:hypothetical protein
MKIITDAIVPNPRWRWWAFWRPRYVAGQLSCTITETGSGPVKPYRWASGEGFTSCRCDKPIRSSAADERPPWCYRCGGRITY